MRNLSTTFAAALIAGGTALAMSLPHAAAAASQSAKPTSAAASGGSAKVLRVCADPDYMPFSNRAGQGFENKIAELVAHAMHRKLEYHWASERGHGGFSNFLALNLDAHKCDVVMELPYGDPNEDYTDSYYRSSYVFVTKKSNHYDITSMHSARLRMVKIGFEEGTAVETALKILGLTQNGVPFHVADNPDTSPDVMLKAVKDGKVGVMVTWEPAIGYYLKDYPGLTVTRVPSESEGPGLPKMPFSFSMAMAVRQGDTGLKTALNKVIKSHQAQIHQILAKYDVRLYPDESGNGLAAGSND